MSVCATATCFKRQSLQHAKPCITVQPPALALQGSCVIEDWDGKLLLSCDAGRWWLHRLAFLACLRELLEGTYSSM